MNTLPPPAITANYTVQNCGDRAKITINEPTNASSYNVLQYSIDGVNFQSGREFPNLQTGRSYTPVLRYGNGGAGALCTVTGATITISSLVVVVRITNAVKLSTTKVSIKTPAIATKPCCAG